MIVYMVYQVNCVSRKKLFGIRFYFYARFLVDLTDHRRM